MRLLSLRQALGKSFFTGSGLLLLLTVYGFTFLPDRLAAFTVMPIWLWSIAGFFLSFTALFFLRTRSAWLLLAAWLLTVLIGADEARVLWHFGVSAPKHGPAETYQGQAVMRVVTMNVSIFSFGNPSVDIAAWRPDIILLQDAAPDHARQIAEAIFGKQYDSRHHSTNAIITRWTIVNDTQTSQLRDKVVTILHPSGAKIQVANVHLRTAVTDLRLWQRTAWTTHRVDSVIRKEELATTLKLLNQSTQSPQLPTILGGDFNSPVTDIVHRQLTPNFTNVFSAVGSGWGNTFHRRLPILRIDHLYVNDSFTPLRCKVEVSRHSDHRMVVADLLLHDTLSPTTP